MTLSNMFGTKTNILQSLKTDHAHLSVQLSQAHSSTQAAALTVRIEHNLNEQHRYNHMFDR